MAALAVLGPNARFTTGSSRRRPGCIVLVGGGDPTLAADRRRPRLPAARDVAGAGRAHRPGAEGPRPAPRSSSSYDTSLYTGPGLAPAGPPYVSTGNVTAIIPLEVDQGRLNASGTPEDADDPTTSRPGPDPAGGGQGVRAPSSPPTASRSRRAVRRQTAPAARLHRGREFLRRCRRSWSRCSGEQQRDRGKPGQARRARHRLSGDVPGGAAAVTARCGGSASIAAFTWWMAVACPRRTRSRPPRWPGCSPLPLPRRTRSCGQPHRAAGGGLFRTLASGQSVFGGFGGTALGAVRAKTGNLSSVAALAGLAYDRTARCSPSRSWPRSGGRLDRPRPSTRGHRTGGMRLPVVTTGATDIKGPELWLTGLASGGQFARVTAYVGGVSTPQMIDWEVAITLASGGHGRGHKSA